VPLDGEKECPFRYTLLNRWGCLTIRRLLSLGMGIFASVLTGVAASAAFWLLTIRVRPRLHLKRTIFWESGPPDRYRLGVTNRGFSDAIDVRIRVELVVAGLSATYPSNLHVVALGTDVTPPRTRGRFRMPHRHDFEEATDDVPAIQWLRQQRLRLSGLRTDRSGESFRSVGPELNWPPTDRIHSGRRPNGIHFRSRRSWRNGRAPEFA
jgi:hypothetical protein